MRIALSTGGGDAPGLNAVIRAAVLSAVNRGWEVLGIKKGYAGLMGEEEVIPMTAATVRGIAHLGGTILWYILWRLGFGETQGKPWECTKGSSLREDNLPLRGSAGIVLTYWAGRA